MGLAIAVRIGSEYVGAVGDILIELYEGIETSDLIFVFFLVLSLFVLLYALNLIQIKIGLLENEI